MGSHQIILILLESCTVNLAGVVENFERAVNSSGLLQLLLQCGLGFVESANQVQERARNLYFANHIRFVIVRYK